MDMWVDSEVVTVAIGTTDLMGIPRSRGGVAHSMRCRLLREVCICTCRVVGTVV